MNVAVSHVNKDRNDRQNLLFVKLNGSSPKIQTLRRRISSL